MKIKVNYNCKLNTKSVVYKLTFENGKCYIGQTIRKLNLRINQHISDSNKGIVTPLYNAIRKYNSFTVDILFQSDEIEELNLKEEMFIMEFNSLINLNGYNIRLGGNNSPLSESTKIKISDSLKNSPKNENRGVNISKALKGKKQPNISKALTGRKNPHKGSAKTDITKEKIKQTMKSKPIVICPHCNKKGKGSNMVRYHFDNCKVFTHLG